MKTPSLLRRITGLLYVPRCGSCGVRLSPEGGALCPACRASYEAQISRRCAFCGHRFSECLCVDAALSRAGIHEVAKLFEYRRGEGDLPANRLLFLLKRKAFRSVVDFFADALADRLDRLLPEERDHLLITWAPRSKKACRRYGFDHMELVARAVADRLSLPSDSLLLRTEGREQKKLGGRDARFTNMKDAYAPSFSREKVADREILLLDDITTSGATLVAAVRALRRGGIKHIRIAVLGCTLLHR